MALEGIKNALPVNWQIISNPINWVIVILMLAIAGVALAYIVPFNPDTTAEVN